MEIGEGLNAFLQADAGIAAVVAARVYPVQLPQNATYPAVRYSTISGQRSVSTPEGATGLARIRLQIDAWAATYAAAYALAELIRKRIDGYRGLMGGVSVQGVFFTDERDAFESEPKLFWVSRDYFVWFEEGRS